MWLEIHVGLMPKIYGVTFCKENKTTLVSF